MALKVYNLRCAGDHAFEGWFTSAEDFESQRRQSLLSCPICASADVRKALSAPYVSTGAAPAEVQTAVMPSADQLQAMMLRLAREVAALTEDVGERFPEEARRIHYKEVPERGIRGQASRDDVRELHDEGITVLPLPFGDLLKDRLQ
jgi:hypothetical protein